ncbi:cupin [Scytonema hofmannii PCC 7110]|uniref:Cupin n=1 Tax=Scytonema hofmannii PCC 7110 TaxID=128403 RepID=A0A139X488_9CYAN|nr:cupin domain-containing protein [Scytonema hofmannii]KYC39494.1 cupin [Scytonema hofmannii PCC 7110]
MTFTKLNSTTDAIETSEVIINPVTGDRMTITHSSLHSHHENFQCCFDLPPGAHGAPLHYHRGMAETFEVLDGELEMELGAKSNVKILRPGEVVYVPPRMLHSFRNASNNWTTYRTEVRSGASFEQFIRGMFGLAIDGKVNSTGTPLNPLQFALLIEKADLVIADAPAFVESIVKRLAQIARWMGVEKSLVKYW